MEMNSDIKTNINSLMNYINSDLFTLENIANIETLSNTTSTDLTTEEWNVVTSYLPLKFYQLIESYPNIYTIEKFDKKYIRNPKMCAYDKYKMTNMWRPLMILNRCPKITAFDFTFIKYYNLVLFTNVISLLMSRVKQNG